MSNEHRTGLNRAERGDNQSPHNGIQCCEYAAEGSLLPIAVTEGEAHVVRYANPAFCRLAGKKREDLMGRPFGEAVPAEEQNGSLSLLDHVYRSGKAESITDEGLPLVRGNPVYWSYAAWALLDQERHPAGVMILAMDVTEATLVRQHCEKANEEIREINQHLLIAGVREQELTDHAAVAEQQLLQAQKMEGIGRLAGGIAHDFNNLLTAILGFTELAEGALQPDDAVQAYLNNIQEAAERAVALTSQLLIFARKQVIQPKVVNLNTMILDINSMLRRLIGENIELVLLPGSDVDQVRIDPGQFGQALVNLVVNARDAMPNGGKITIETANIRVEKDSIHRHGEVTSGDYVLLVVSDTGTGMTDEAQAHLFEPFFTTKDPGKGTGMGLASCYGIVTQSGGSIQVVSAPDVGTTFKIFLPRVDEAVSQAPRKEASPFLRGTETIVLVEDEPMVREIGARMLRQRGYHVFESSDAMEALRLIREYVGKIDLVVTDLVMPQMSGRELATNLHLTHPHIKVLYISGYTADTIVHKGIVDSDLMFLQKPFTSTTLAQKVREALEQNAF